MTAPLSADVVNAFIDPMVEVIRSICGIEPSIAPLRLTQEIDPPPSLSVTIEVKGDHLSGPVIWVFSRRVAELIAQRMLAGTDGDLALLNEAVSETANIICGNATGRLLEAGFAVEIVPPRCAPQAPTAADLTLAERTLSVAFRSEAGEYKVLIGVKVKP